MNRRFGLLRDRALRFALPVSRVLRVISYPLITLRAGFACVSEYLGVPWQAWLYRLLVCPEMNFAIISWVGQPRSDRASEIQSIDRSNGTLYSGWWHLAGWPGAYLIDISELCSLERL